MKGSHRVLRLGALGLVGAMLTGCVMAEKYEQEKARSLNFQRLLAQEEKRTGELDAELKKVRRQLAEVKRLAGLLPYCSSCGKLRLDLGDGCLLGFWRIKERADE